MGVRESFHVTNDSTCAAAASDAGPAAATFAMNPPSEATPLATPRFTRATSSSLASPNPRASS